jgi:prepilin-type N-terminal cleavage/methylation domain-containing protein
LFCENKQRGAKVIRKRREHGFSIIEVLVVCAIIGIIASLAIPFLQKAIRATENGSTFATMRSVSSTQMSYYGQHNRFGRLTEINNIMSHAIGTPSGNEVTRGKFIFSMSPDPNPTDAQLKDGYTILATRNVTGEGVIYQYELTETGEIRQLFP